MAFDKLNGIVLRYADYKENDRILTVLTRERGLVSLTARGVRSNKPNAACAVKDILCCGEFVVYERNGIEYISSSSVTEAFYPIREDYDRFSAAAQIAATIKKVGNASKNDELYMLVYYTLSFLAYSEASCKDLLIGFYTKLIVIEGYEPIITYCAGCGKSVLNYKQIRFSNQLGGSLCDECASEEAAYSAGSMEALRRIILLESRELYRIRLSDNMQSELFKLLSSHMEYSMGQSIPHIK